MCTHRRLFALIASFCTVVFARADDPADDPLPPGAKARFGISRAILRTNPAIGLVPPKLTTFLAPTVNGGVRPYDLGTGRPLVKGGPLVGPGQVVVCGDGSRAAVMRPGAITIIDVATRKLVLAVQPPEGVIVVGVAGASFSADGKSLAYGGRLKDGLGGVVVWNVDKNELIARVETLQSAPVFPLLAADGKTLVTHGPPPPPIAIRDPQAPMSKAKEPTPPEDADKLRTAQVWDVAGAKELFQARVTGMGGQVVSSAISPDGTLITLSSGDGPIDLFDGKTGKRTQTLLGRKAQGAKIAIAPDGKTIASVGPDFRIMRWSRDGEPLDTTDPPPGMINAPVTGLTFLDNERAVAWQTVHHFAVAWEAPTGRLISPLMDHAAPLHSMAFAEDGKDFFSSGFEGRAFRWDLATGQLNQPIQFHPARIPGQPRITPIVSYSANAKLALWARLPASSEVFDVVSGSDLFAIPAPSAPPGAVGMHLSPEGTMVVTTSRGDGQRGGMCCVWNLETQRRIVEFELPPSIAAVAPGANVSPSGKRILVLTTNRKSTGAGEVMTMTAFDSATGKRLSGVEDPSARGTVAVTAINDTTAILTATSGRIWSVDYAAEKVGDTIDTIPGRPFGEPANSNVMAVSPDGKYFAIAVVGEQQETFGVRVYEWPSGKLQHTFIGHVGPVGVLRFSPDSKFLVSGSQDTSVILWDLAKHAAPK